MTMKFRALLALAALVGLGAAATPGANAAEGYMYQCWYRVGVDSPNTCYVCSGPCLGAEYVCCGSGGEELQ